MPLGPTLTHHEERQLAIDVHRLMVRYPFGDLLVYLRAAAEAQYGTTSAQHRAIDEAYRRLDELLHVDL